MTKIKTLRYLPTRYAQDALDKLHSDGYERVNTPMIYNVVAGKTKCNRDILRVLLGIAVNHYQLVNFK